MSGMTAGGTMETGKITRCMGRGCLLGITESGMKGSTRMTKRMAMESSHGN